MNLPVELYDHPAVRVCMDDAYRRMEGWSVTHHPDCIKAKELLTSGWDGVALRDILLEPLLGLQGITDEDIDIFELMLDERKGWPDKTSRNALYEEWDMERAEARKLEAT